MQLKSSFRRLCLTESLFMVTFLLCKFVVVNLSLLIMTLLRSLFNAHLSLFAKNTSSVSSEASSVWWFSFQANVLELVLKLHQSLGVI